MQLTATYSPEDNKLRLYASERLDNERVRANGFIWAPKQKLFVAPMWTPGRADFLMELCGEIGDEDTSLVDRAEQRSERFEGYQGKRAEDASRAREYVASIADNIPFGQPILIGHHSEKHARKNAERIENGMRKAVKMWETSEYWKSRAAGVLAHAKYKERPDVRARRIKTIAADRRKWERARDDSKKFIGHWEKEGLTLDRAKAIANHDHISKCFPLAEFPRDPPASQYEGKMSIWSALDGGVITALQAQYICVRAHQRTIERAQRWIDHCTLRIEYETALLGEAGGTAADKWDLQPGGQVLIRGEWLTITKVTRKEGRAVSVSTNARFVRVRGVEEISDYREPTAELAEQVKQANKLPPLVNYRSDGCLEMNKAQWKLCERSGSGYAKRMPATEEHGAHRQRTTYRGGYKLVFLTDSKVIERPAPSDKPKVVLPRSPAIRVEPLLRVEPKEESSNEADFEAMRQTLKHGIKVVSANQLFPTPRELARRMIDLATDGAGCVGRRVLEPSAGTGVLLEAIIDSATGADCCKTVAVEVNPSLAAELERRRNLRLYANDQNHKVICADFLECDRAQLGTFDAVVMNPPFENAVDIRHIKHALTMLKPGGRLVAICAAGSRQHAQLKPIVEEHGGEWEQLPDDTFAQQGTNVRTVLLVITAPVAAELAA